MEIERKFLVSRPPPKCEPRYSNRNLAIQPISSWAPAAASLTH
jgi:CYTH domain-containing protein